MEFNTYQIRDMRLEVIRYLYFIYMIWDKKYMIYQVYAIRYIRLMVWDIKDWAYVKYQIPDNICEINHIKCIWYMELSQYF